MANFSIVLIAPEIPGNTGSIGRTCLALGARLIIVGKPAFDLSEKAVRRAGLDYWKHVQLKEYETWESFIELEEVKPAELFLLENHQPQSLFEAKYGERSFLIFGSETKGIPHNILQNYEKRIFSLPMYSEHIRSLNLSNVATAVAYDWIRKKR